MPDSATRYDVFLSHNSADKAAVEAIARRLIAAGIQTFLDKWHLIPGTPWQESSEEALAASTATAVFIGPSGISPWHNEEMRDALDQAVRSRGDYRVIPVLLPGASEDSASRFLARRVWVDFRAGLDDAEALQRLCAGIRGEAIDPGTYRLPDEPAPYRGLLRFEAEHARFFFGRDADTKRLIQKVSRQPFVAVVGASGCGKSSLVRAGLLPTLGDALPGSRDWQGLTFTPGSQPLRSLANQPVTFVPLPDRPDAADKLTRRLADRPDGLRTTLAAFLADRPRPILLFVDQFEELFTLCADDPERCRMEAEQFIVNLADAAERGDGQVRVIITLRADFLDRCLTFPSLRKLLEDCQLLLGPLSQADLRDAIVRPAQQVGAFLEKGLVNTILADVGDEPGNLPLLQHALHELWLARRGPWLTLDAYEASGGVRGALGRRAQATYDALTTEQQAIARAIFLRLTALGDGGNDTRRRADRAELYPVSGDRTQVDAVIQTLSGPSARLVVAEAECVEVAHDALIRGWDALHNWLEESRDALQTHRRLTETANEWSRHQDSSLLYRGIRLAQAAEWARAHPDDVNALEAGFLKASSSAEAQSNRVRSIAITAIIALVMIAAAVVSLSQSQLADQRLHAQQTAESLRATAEEQARRAQAGELAALSANALVANPSDPSLPLLLAVEAAASTWPRDGYITPNASKALLTAAAAAPPWRQTFQAEPKAEVFSAVYNSSGTQVVTASQDGMVRVWEVAIGQQKASLRVSRSGVRYAAFDSSGTLLAAGDADGNLYLWTNENEPTIRRRHAHEGSINSVSFSPDSKQIATAGSDGTARIWDVGSGRQVLALVGHPKQVNSVSFSLDGKRIVTASDDGTARIWGTTDGVQLIGLVGHRASVESARFNTAGDRVITASIDRTARIWDANTGKEITQLLGHTEGVSSATYSKSGAFIATASGTPVLYAGEASTGSPDAISLNFSRDGAARIWGAISGKEVLRLYGHTDRLNSVVFSPDDRYVLTASADGTVRSWAVASKALWMIVQEEWVSSALFSPDGERVVTAGFDGSVRMWSIRTQQEVLQLVSHQPVATAASFSPDGRRIVSAATDASVRIWDAISGHELMKLVGHTASVRSASFSPDSRRIVTAGDDGTARVWEVATGREQLLISGSARTLTSAVFSPDNTRIAAAGADGTAIVWDALSGAEVVRLVGHNEHIYSIVFSPTGDRLATASQDRTARIWDAVSGAEIAQLIGHSVQVNAVAFSPDGQRIATASGGIAEGDDTVRIWDASSGRELFQLGGHVSWVNSVAFSPDGTHVLTASADKSVRIWPATPEGLISTAQSLVQRNPPVLTAEERERYGIQ